MEYDSTSQHLSIEACAPLPQDIKPVDLAVAYLSLCDLDSSSLSPFFTSDPDTPLDPLDRHLAQLRLCALAYTILDARMLLAIFAGKKYKPVALKVRPVETELPSWFCIMRNIKGDPLKDIPLLPTHPPPYQLTGCYMEERKGVIDQAHPGDFLLPAKCALMHSFMSIQNTTFTWCDPEHGHFREDFFPPIDILTIPYKPWAAVGWSGTSLSHLESMRNYVASSRSNSTWGSMNPPTLPTVRAGSASSRRMENHFVSSTVLSHLIASPLNTLGSPHSQIRLANTSPGTLAAVCSTSTLATMSAAWQSHLTTSPLSSLPLAHSDSSCCRWVGQIQSLYSMTMSPTSYSQKYPTLQSLTSMMSLSMAPRHDMSWPTEVKSTSLPIQASATSCGNISKASTTSCSTSSIVVAPSVVPSQSFVPRRS